METYESDTCVNLDVVYNELEGLAEENSVKRVERGFGVADEPHIFFRGDSYNGFLYEDRAALHILKDKKLEREDPVSQVISSYYEELEDTI